MDHRRDLVQQLFLLDTNILSEVIKNPLGKIASKLREIPSESIATSVIVSCELRFGAEKKGSSKLLGRVDDILKMIHVLPLSTGVGHVYARTRHSMERQGHGISAHDLLIASQAIFFNASLVTQNQQDFSRVPGLTMECWEP